MKLFFPHIALCNAFSDLFEIILVITQQSLAMTFFYKGHSEYKEDHQK